LKSSSVSLSASKSSILSSILTTSPEAKSSSKLSLVKLLVSKIMASLLSGVKEALFTSYPLTLRTNSPLPLILIELLTYPVIALSARIVA